MFDVKFRYWSITLSMVRFSLSFDAHLGKGPPHTTRDSKEECTQDAYMPYIFIYHAHDASIIINDEQEW